MVQLVVGMTTDGLFGTQLDFYYQMVILPKRVNLLADQLFTILWGLSIFSEKLACTGLPR